MSLTSLLVRGPFHGPSGYDHHTRELVRAIAAQGVAVQLVDVPEWSPARLPPEHVDPWFDSLDQDVGARVAVHFTMPHQIVPYPGLVNVNYTMFEASRVHPTWIAHNSRHDRVVVPTESSRQAWIASGIDPSKLRVSPLGIDPERFGVAVAPRSLTAADGRPISSYRTRLLNVSELSPRKNQAGLLRAWLRATTPRDDAILILKLGLYSPGWQQEWDQTLARLQAETGTRLNGAAPIHVLHALLGDEEMPGLYAAATHYLSVSRGEGWDQAMVEAGATGLRLIAPRHSAYLSYLDTATATLLPVREVPARFPGGGEAGLLFAGACWWEPDEDAAVAAIRAAIERRDAPRHAIRERLLHELTWEQSARKLLRLLDQAERERSGGRRRLLLPWPRRG